MKARGPAVMRVVKTTRQSGPTSRDRAYVLAARCCERHLQPVRVRVVDAVDEPDGTRSETVQTTAEPGCPGCGVIARRAHSARLQRVRDVVVAGHVNVLWAKRRWFCDEVLCARRTFSEATAEVPAYARSTSRLRQALVGGGAA